MSKLVCTWKAHKLGKVHCNHYQDQGHPSASRLNVWCTPVSVNKLSRWAHTVWLFPSFWNWAEACSVPRTEVGWGRTDPSLHVLVFLCFVSGWCLQLVCAGWIEHVLCLQRALGRCHVYAVAHPASRADVLSRDRLCSQESWYPTKWDWKSAFPALSVLLFYK